MSVKINHVIYEVLFKNYPTHRPPLHPLHPALQNPTPSTAPLPHKLSFRHALPGPPPLLLTLLHLPPTPPHHDHAPSLHTSNFLHVGISSSVVNQCGATFPPHQGRYLPALWWHDTSLHSVWAGAARCSGNHQMSRGGAQRWASISCLRWQNLGWYILSMFFVCLFSPLLCP